MKEILYLILIMKNNYYKIHEKIKDRIKKQKSVVGKEFSNYEKECKKQNIKPLISFKTLRDMNCLEFFKYWQKRINYAGKRIKRKAHNIKASI